MDGHISFIIMNIYAIRVFILTFWIFFSRWNASITLLVTYMAVCKNVYDLQKVQQAENNIVIVMDVIDMPPNIQHTKND